MTCRELAELLLDYLDGELEAERCAWIRGHLEACPECVHFVKTYQLTIEVTRRLPATELPPEVAERMQKTLENG
jgi:anti-sigma factor RsiW